MMTYEQLNGVSAFGKQNGFDPGKGYLVGVYSNDFWGQSSTPLTAVKLHSIEQAYISFLSFPFHDGGVHLVDNTSNPQQRLAYMM